MNGSKELHKIPLPLVSIVTPSYNSFPYIQETVESVQMQDYPHIEHIVIDGGSTDGTVEFLQEEPDIIWVSEPDRGQSHALNKGFQQARGEIIGWLNADDTYQPGAISTAVYYLLENDDIDMVHSDLLVINNISQPLGIRRSQHFDLTTHLFENHIKQPTVFIRRQVLSRLGGVNENLHYVMDKELWLRIGLEGFNMHYLQDQTLANFRKYPGTKSYEQTPLFYTEWLTVLENVFCTPGFNIVSDTTQKMALKQNTSLIYFAKMGKAIDQKDRKMMLYFLFHSIFHNWRIMLNRGTWYFFSLGLLGLKRNRFRKYKNK